MEVITVQLNKPEEFERLRIGTDGAKVLPEGCDLQFVTKDGATDEGAAAVIIAFSVQLPDGRIARAQAVTTVKLLLQTARILRARYGDDGKPSGAN